jgi:RNA polymerase sigma-70 factor (ECF subfamily)
MFSDLDHHLPKARELDEGALTEIYRALNRRLFAYAYRMVGEAGEAEDLVAETFRRFLTGLRSGGGPQAHVAPYLYRTLHNLITDRYRRSQPTAPLDEALEAGVEADPAETAELDLTQAHARAALWRLTSEQRLVITLKYFEELNNDAVARTLGKTVGTVKSLQHRGLEALRRALAAEMLEGVETR